MPPSPVVMTLRGWNEYATSPPLPPIGVPRCSAPSAARGILHHLDVTRIAEGVDVVEIGGHSRLVDHQHRSGRRGERSFDGGRGEVQRLRVDVREHRALPTARGALAVAM